MRAFDLLHQSIREAVYQQEWKELRPLQVDAIHAILEASDHLILAAATASGKTEAAFLPILSKIAARPSASVQAIYVSPLKALINDQFGRLGALCQIAQIPVHRWHGDVGAGEKRRLRDTPSGVLLITPESLESQCINHGSSLPKIYGGLEFIVVDELHAFLEGVRGIHLQSLISRICRAASCSPRKLGLSATLGDFAPAQRFLSNSGQADVRILKEENIDREIRVGLKVYVKESDNVEEANSTPLTAERALAADIAKRFRKSTNLIFCNSRALAEETADHLNEIAAMESWPGNPFLIHHGSLSKELRECTESDLKSGRPATALCTRTLEMGIDIGSVHTVGQIGAPWSVASLVQRVGRSGRREGEPQILRFYVMEQSVSGDSAFSEGLYPELLRAVALVELMLRRWVETPPFGRKHYSTLVHQVLSMLRQTGGCQAESIFRELCSEGAFDVVTKKEFAKILHHLAAHLVVQQMETGDIILAPKGEKIVESRDFYSAFASAIEFSIEHGSDKIGVLPRDHVPPPGQYLLLAGRRWMVTDIEDSAKRVNVIPGKGKKLPVFRGSGGGLDPEVMIEMKRILTTNEVPRYLDPMAVKCLTQARKHFRLVLSDQPAAFLYGKSVRVLPWAGTAIHNTLVGLAKADGLNTELSRDGLMITFAQHGIDDVLAHWSRVAAGGIPRTDLIPTIQNPFSERFHELIPVELLTESHINEFLDFEGAVRVARTLCQ